MIMSPESHLKLTSLDFSLNVTAREFQRDILCEKNKTKISDIQKLLKVSCRPTLYYDKQTELPFVCRKATKISTALSVVLRVGNASKGVSLGRHADVLLRKRYDDGLQTCWMIVFKVGWITECTVYIGLQYRINNGRQV